LGNADRRPQFTKNNLHTKQSLNNQSSTQYIPHKPTHASDILTVSHPSPLDVYDKHYPPGKTNTHRPQQPVPGKQVKLWQTFATSGPLDDVCGEFGIGFGDVSAYMVAEGREEDGEGWGEWAWERVGGWMG